MKITGNYFNSQIEKKTIQKPNNMEPAALKNKAQSVDTITISNASKDTIAENQFINTLRNQISSEVKASISPQELNSISDQVAKGEYEINANEIAKKILLADSDI
ncbi:flagellar biosynthesis anti-sigma factor FlgM [Clostridium aminobutyricum]|uniref:Flagellar biosynthesis anti-sigma factor FlgM n=1 Tax=Clostridium aminobutyricum TaxID=33953 RepID=A0A939D9W2_CLOAM|nr:flagellar biosynthesis anti-sigma factor FlgM [Clostridium aminobutyricum]MBN7773737.1 flagellar biosynthesis anti-sigma factor FlgM [Clostridium aminobutyricum]